MNVCDEYNKKVIVSRGDMEIVYNSGRMVNWRLEEWRENKEKEKNKELDL